jgi:hypothetical protein
MNKFTIWAIISFLLGLSSAILTVSAQCDNCPKTETKADYCYTDPRFSGSCLAFFADKPVAYYFSSPKTKTPIEVKVVNSSSPDSLVNVITALPKLTGKDLVFLQLGFVKWNKEKMSLGFTFTPSGLGYKIVQKGTGKIPEAKKKVKVHYKGYLEDGTKFDSSFDRNQPFEFTLGVGQVIKGWDEGIQLFPVGSKGTLKIPAELGYGSRANGSIPANATLYFDIEVVSAD